ncbi:MAG: hypothetical protein IPP96_08765 [Chitinophagaceae bacterium]|nr:hypothetical protein [Chitinophagaceae bacterium]
MKKLLLPVFLIGSIAMIFVMAKTGATLKTPATPHGILDLEIAYNTAKTSVVMNEWAPVNGLNNITAAKTNTWFDFLFLFFYSIFLFLACKRIAQSINGPFARAGNIIATGALLAGFLDVLENSGMLISLGGHSSGIVSFLTTFFSVIKWALALLAVLYLLTGLLVLGWQKMKK